ncbi:hypothetical protein VKT23_016620 [Stygiomarasmius scandens]|uniref:Uncharacterized protein n=1 Tax=Marasmiellus scandens TaxID=2682957 RepID=A0ABR1IYL8_9AGAR
MEHAAKMSNTRMCLTIIGEGETDDKLFMSCVQIGSTPEPNPKKFHEWDQVGFQMSHIRSFAEFVKSCVRLEKGLEAYPPQYSSAVPLVESISPFTPDPEAKPNAEAGPSKPKPKRQAKRSMLKRKGRKVKDDKSSAESSHQSESEEDEFSGDSGDEDSDEEDELQEELTPPSTPRLRRGYKLNQHLEKELTEMLVSDRRKKMGQLAKLLRDDFDWENILAQNRHLQKEAGLLDAATLLNNAMAAANAEKRKGKQKGKAKVVKGQGQEKGKEKETTELRRSTRRAAKASLPAPEPVHTHEEGHVTTNIDSIGNDVPMSVDPIAGDVPVTVTGTDDTVAVDEDVFIHNDLPVPPNATMKLLMLRALIPHLPNDLGEAKDSDTIATCYHDGTWTPELSLPQAWETWNGILDTVTQRLPTETEQEYLDKVVKSGKKGTEALYRAFAHVMEHVVMDPDMLEGKIDRIIAAIEKK